MDIFAYCSPQDAATSAAMVILLAWGLGGWIDNDWMNW